MDRYIVTYLDKDLRLCTSRASMPSLVSLIKDPEVHRLMVYRPAVDSMQPMYPAYDPKSGMLILNDRYGNLVSYYTPGQKKED